MQSALGGAAASNADIDFLAVDGITICRIKVRPSGSPTGVSVRDDDWFYVRPGNSTRRLSTRARLSSTPGRQRPARVSGAPSAL